MEYQKRLMQVVRNTSLLGIVGTLITGCGTSYVVDRVPDSELRPVLDEPGIYYSLPKTSVVVELIAAMHTTTVGPYIDEKRFRKGLLSCQSNPSAEIAIGDTSNTRRQLVLGKPKVSAVSSADSAHRYRLNVNFAAFNSAKHTVKVNKLGVITNADSKVTNTSVLIAMDVFKAVLPVVTAFAMTAPSSVLRAGKSTTCIAIEKVRDTLKKHERAYQHALQKIHADRNAFVLGQGLSAKPDAFKEALAIFARRQTALKKALGKNKAYQDARNQVFGLTNTKIYQLLGTATPTEFQAFTSGVKWRVTKQTGKDVKGPGAKAAGSTVLSYERNKGAPSPNLNTWPEVLGLDITITADEPFAELQCPAGGCPQSDAKGHRYRLPAQATIEVSLATASATPGALPKPKIIATGHHSIAQYGPIAVLPNRINGLEGNIVLALDENTGSYTSITVGATPLPTDTVSSLTNGVLGTVEKIRAKALAEATEKKNAELTRITAENDLLNAKKNNRDLKDALGLE